MSENIYLFTGLGGDERSFMNLDFGGNQVQYMEWLKPLSGESIESYAGRYAQQITSENPVLVGYSFGGVIAVEISKLLPGSRVILIASVKTWRNVPFYFRVAGKLRLYRFITLSRVLKVRSLLPFLFTAITREEKNLVVDMLRKTDPEVFKWSVEKICTWRNTESSPATVQIHGTRDRVLPYRFVKCDYSIKRGNHLMILNRAGEISELLKRIISAK